MKVLCRSLTAVSTLGLATSLLMAAAPSSQSIVSITETAGILDPSLQREVDAAIDRGLDWLANQQREDGSWSNADFPALTSLALWAFSRSPHPQRELVMNRAVDYILSCTHSNGAIFRHVEGRKGGGLSNYNTAICMTALHATGRPELRPIVQRARTFVAGTQYMGDDHYRGGFGYDPGTQRAYTDMLNTFYAAQAMRLTADAEESRPSGESRADINWNETVSFIERMQNSPETGDEAGGMFYNPVDPKAGTVTNQAGTIVFRSYGSITYAGILSMVFADVDRTDTRVRSALDWAEHHWTLDENPGMGQEGRYFFYHVLTRALDAVGRDTIHRDDGTTLNWKREVARTLIGLQRIDAETGAGYWINDAGRYWENDPVLVTAYSLMALQAL
ncbi:MAG: terpene cyclase/mutase family protein [Verrucomicrobia bacterium]|nr:terpene cyclase/mutase family protein [Verrucomicrobiota bacterium]